MRSTLASAAGEARAERAPEQADERGTLQAL